MKMFRRRSRAGPEAGYKSDHRKAQLDYYKTNKNTAHWNIKKRYIEAGKQAPNSIKESGYYSVQVFHKITF